MKKIYFNKYSYIVEHAITPLIVFIKYLLTPLIVFIKYLLTPLTNKISPLSVRSIAWLVREHISKRTH